MIEINNLVKEFDGFKAVNGITTAIDEGHVFGLVGTNGAGKSTLLRMISGVLKPSEGEVVVDGRKVYDNAEVKKDIFYISDEQYFPCNTPADLERFYKSMYEGFDSVRFAELLEKFGLDKNRRINTCLLYTSPSPRDRG